MHSCFMEKHTRHPSNRAIHVYDLHLEYNQGCANFEVIGKTYQESVSPSPYKQEGTSLIVGSVTFHI